MRNHSVPFTNEQAMSCRTGPNKDKLQQHFYWVNQNQA